MESGAGPAYDGAMNARHACRTGCVTLALATVAFTALIIGTGESARAQFPDLVDFSAGYLPDVPIEVPGHAGVRAQVASYNVAVNVPIVLSPKTFLVPGLAYRVDAVSYLNAPDGFAELRAFHALEVPLLFAQLLPHDWTLALRVAPGVASDFRDIDTGALRLSGAALAVHAFSDEVSLGFGAIASYGFGSFMVLPALLLTLGSDDALVAFELMVPAFAKFKVRAAPGLELGLRAEVSGSSYQVSDPRVAKRWPCVDGELPADASRCFDNLAYSVVDASAYVAVNVWGTLWLDLSVGHTLYRRFEAYDADGEQDADGGDVGGQDLPNTWGTRVGLTLRLPSGP